jgi:MYXO-CTERM domain-containing protein
MIDAAGDTVNATGALDIVGTSGSPAGFHAADKDFLFLRLRVAADPRAPDLQPNAWGWELDLDENRSTYELLFTLSGLGPTDTVDVYTNGSVQIANDPADPSDLPPLFSYDAASHARISAAGTGLGGGSDYFIDLAIPWVDLAQVLVTHGTRVGIWAGSSTVPNALDLDLACWSGPGGGHLSDIEIGITTPDPDPTGGGGSGGTGGTGGGGNGGSNGNNERTLEGGPGCSVASAAAGGANVVSAGFVALLGVLLLWSLARRRQRR